MNYQNASGAAGSQNQNWAVIYAVLSIKLAVVIKRKDRTLSRDGSVFYLGLWRRQGD
jgi:hypothetical protein